jgi:hypothetical protein
MNTLRQEERQELQLLRRIGTEVRLESSAQSTKFQIEDMVSAAEQHRRLCKQLLVNNPGDSTKTEDVLVAIARLVANIQADTETGLIPLLTQQGLLARTSSFTEKQ